MIVLATCYHPPLSFSFSFSFPLPQVPVPITSILALINRILSVDGSRKLPDMDLPMLSVDASFSREHQQALCCELPALHTAALRLLTALLEGCRR